MKRSDEIKKGLECCNIGPSAHQPKCGECPYKFVPMCSDTFLKDALALIQQLQAENAELLKKVEKLQKKNEAYEQSAIKCCYESTCSERIKKLESLCQRLTDEKEQLQAERDAAVADMMIAAVNACDVCKSNELIIDEAPCQNCMHIFKGRESKFEWRGLVKEETT